MIDGLEQGARSSTSTLLRGNKRPDTLIHLLLNGILVPIWYVHLKSLQTFCAILSAQDGKQNDGFNTRTNSPSLTWDDLGILQDFYCDIDTILSKEFKDLLKIYFEEILLGSFFAITDLLFAYQPSSSNRFNFLYYFFFGGYSDKYSMLLVTIANTLFSHENNYQFIIYNKIDIYITNSHLSLQCNISHRGRTSVTLQWGHQANIQMSIVPFLICLNLYIFI